MSVLAGFGGGHLHDLARPPFQHHETVLAQGGALHRKGGGRAGVPGLEVQICIRHSSTAHAQMDSLESYG